MQVLAESVTNQPRKRILGRPAKGWHARLETDLERLERIRRFVPAAVRPAVAAKSLFPEWGSPTGAGKRHDRGRSNPSWNYTGAPRRTGGKMAERKAQVKLFVADMKAKRTALGWPLAELDRRMGGKAAIASQVERMIWLAGRGLQSRITAALDRGLLEMSQAGRA